MPWQQNEPSETEGSTEVDPDRVLGQLAQRWRGAIALEYRSEAIMSHAGEFHLNVRIHVWLRRPSLARIVFRASDFPEADRLRVCDGRLIYDRPFGKPGDTGRTIISSLNRPGLVTENIAHPLDETGYSVSQFFSTTPFVPPTYWNNQPGPLKIRARRRKQAERSLFEITFTKGAARDTLTLDAISYAPVQLIRVGDHGGRVQELLRETFVDVQLNPPAPDVLFRWSPRDNAGYSETPR